MAEKKLPDSVETRRAMIEVNHPELSVRRQCELIGLNRATWYYTPAAESDYNLELMRRIDEQYTRTPFYGSPKETRRCEEATSEMEKARRYVEECLARIAAHGVAGIEYPFQVYLTCARVLEVCGERERAQVVLEEAYALLMQRADEISSWRRRGRPCVQR